MPENLCHKHEQEREEQIVYDWVKVQVGDQYLRKLKLILDNYI